MTPVESIVPRERPLFQSNDWRASRWACRFSALFLVTANVGHVYPSVCVCAWDDTTPITVKDAHSSASLIKQRERVICTLPINESARVLCT